VGALLLGQLEVRQVSNIGDVFVGDIYSFSVVTLEWRGCARGGSLLARSDYELNSRNVLGHISIDSGHIPRRECLQLLAPPGIGDFHT
jgi:hypothetical protein